MVCGGAFGQEQKIAQKCVESRRKFSPTKAKAELNEPQLHGHVVCAARSDLGHFLGQKFGKR